MTFRLPDFAFDDEGHGLFNGRIDGPGPVGLIRCRLCGRFEVMPVYTARWGKRQHSFGLHPTCGRAYFARLKDGDIIGLIEIERLACVGGPKRPRPIFSYDY